MPPDPPQPLDYHTPAERTSFWQRPWTLRMKIIAAVVVVVGAFILLQIGGICAFVLSNFRD